jgi:hypothetical protein
MSFASADDAEHEKRREKFRRDALTAWADYRATRRHLTAQEADSSLAQLEADQDADPPSAR